MSVMGHVISVEFPQRLPVGIEQEGERPAVVVGDCSLLGPMRFPIVLVVPLTSVVKHRLKWQAKAPDLYPILAAGLGASGIASDSIVLLDQVTAIDPDRVRRHHGKLTDLEYQPIADGLLRALGPH